MKFPAIAVLLALGASATSLPARADPCEGDRLESQTLWSGADELGLLEVYYDRLNKEYCTELQHTGITKGKAAYTRVSLAECKDWSCREVAGPVFADDGPDYVEKAGPTRLKARPQGQKQCVIATGTMIHDKEIRTVRGTRHCR